MNQIPKGWKTYDEFAYGIDTNRLPATEALAGSSHKIDFDDGRTLELAFAKGKVEWSDGKEGGTHRAETSTDAVKVSHPLIVRCGCPGPIYEAAVLQQVQLCLPTVSALPKTATDGVARPINT
ncbi:MoaF N-terminal domain-containing protein [Ensifer aridi]|uniref:MoaF N-terminal domain-containing protein n=1 Tax=Ensifer aridi TaxID=1708715 RepID=UPI0009C0F615|nr:MoaF N-terminal domain-containing protein [Ensifer aridi]